MLKCELNPKANRSAGRPTFPDSDAESLSDALLDLFERLGRVDGDSRLLFVGERTRKVEIDGSHGRLRKLS